ncbi:MAG TPA: paraquat-inducible protein A [Usitatibacter sp.]|nr:paraquat-inducible protein A [Usitatibacter sp.]
MNIATAARRGMVLCSACRMINRAAGSGELACARCGAHLHFRKPNSIARSWAFLVAAGIFYIPANLLPVLHTGSIFQTTTDTIMSGVVHLWVTGSWVLAAIVFVASIVVPGAKLISMAVLLTSAQRRSRWRPQARARLYRATAYIGRWSMVDIFVGATLVALVQFNLIASILPGPGAIAFGAVVVLTMLASQSFDPRLTWDGLEEARG